MSDGTRRSGRANKGVHTKASSSPGPNAKPAEASKARSKKAKKSADDGEDDEDDVIRCICGNDDPNDKRAFIGCEACLVWQHNVCMGEPEDQDDIPEHYFCEECRPEDHVETVQAIENGERIWEKRNAQWKAWKKMSAQRRKSKGKGEDAKPSWLKAEYPEAGEAENADSQEAGTKRKRESVKPEAEAHEAEDKPEQQIAQSARPDKRRKSSQAVSKMAVDVDTAVVAIDQLPADRKNVAEALSKIIATDIQGRAKSGFRVPDGHTAKSLGERYAALIEYALHMNHGEPKEAKYAAQFRAINANLKKNKVLVERLLESSLTADELSLMESKDMASEELQQQRAKMKEELDRQAVAIQDEGPMYRRTHKGDEIIEDETHRATDFGNSHPVRERTSMAEDGAGSPPNMDGPGSPTQSYRPAAIDTGRPSASDMNRRTSSQNFDMNNIWAKTAQSPTTGTAQPRPLQMPPRRRSSAVNLQASNDGAKDDPDVDRLLQDDDETYSPADYTGDDTIVWRGKLVHAGEGEPTVNARFVAGRDLAPTVAWRDLLPDRLHIDGRLQISKAEEYLCGLEWSHTSDVSVLAFTPYDDAAAFNKVFDYFKIKQRYAVINKGKPLMVKDLYVIPVEVGGSLPDHVEKLAHCTIKLPIEERLLLATFVVNRSPETPPIARPDATPSQQPPVAANGQQHLPQHVRTSVAGPSGSPLNTNAPTFSPSQNAPPTTGYGVIQGQPPFPANPYQAGAQPGPYQPAQAQGMPVQVNPMVADILGPYTFAPSAQQIVNADPNIAREKLIHLRKIMDEDVEARTSVEALAAKLFAGN